MKAVISATCGAAGLIALGVATGFRRATARGKTRLACYDARTVRLSYGDMTYVDEGPGEPVLSLQGLFGGYDQGFDVVHAHDRGYRIIAPSRFGYLGSTINGDGTPADQADALVELLDRLGVDETYVLGASAGGTSAIRFALDHPERTKGLILFSAAMPYPAPPHRYSTHAGPPPFLCHDLPMYLLSPFFPLVMGMPASTIDTMFPLAQRREGALLDATVANPDMARSFDDYPIEQVRCPVLVLQGSHDRLAKVGHAEAVLARFPQKVYARFEGDGHLLAKHQAEVTEAISSFITATRDEDRDPGTEAACEERHDHRSSNRGGASACTESG